MNQNLNNEDSNDYSYDSETPKTGAVFHGIDPYNTDFIKDPKNFEDPVEKLKSKKKTNKIIIASIALIIALGVGLTTYNLVSNDTSTKGSANQNQADQEVKEVDPTTGETISAELPLAEAFADAKATPKGYIKAEVKKDILKTSNNKELAVSGYEIIKTQQNCTVSKASEFCLAGRVKVSEAKEVFIYLLKDARNSRLMEKPQDFNLTEVSGAKVAATMKIALPNPGTSILATVNLDNSGFIFAYPENMTQEEINDFNSKVKIDDTDKKESKS